MMSKPVKTCPILSPDGMVASLKQMKDLLIDVKNAGDLAYEIDVLTQQISAIDDALLDAQTALFKDLSSFEAQISSTLKHMHYFGCFVGTSDESIRGAGHNDPFYLRLDTLSNNGVFKDLSPDGLKAVEGYLELMGLFKTRTLHSDSLEYGRHLF